MAAQLQTKLKPVEDNDAVPDEVLVHVRFHPSAEIMLIGEQPARVSASDWFKHLLANASQYYQVFAGGRGFFRIPRHRFEAIVSALPQ